MVPRGLLLSVDRLRASRDTGRKASIQGRPWTAGLNTTPSRLHTVCLSRTAAEWSGVVTSKKGDDRCGASAGGQ